MHAHNHAALVYLFCGKYVEGNALIDEALALADEKGAAFWKNHATAHQGCIFALTGELLAPVYGWFTEGFDTLDLKQAKALLDELAG
jgi:hypothetical protein